MTVTVSDTEEDIRTRDGLHKYAGRIMREHGLSTWKLKIGTAKRLAGTCYSGRRQITLSHTLLSQWPVEEIRDTILHEIAHALTPNGVGHGKEWKAKCVEIGANPTRTYEDSLPQPEGNWIRSCPCDDNKGVVVRRSRGRHFRSCGHDVLYRKVGESVSKAKPFKRVEEQTEIKGSVAWGKQVALSMGATVEGGWADAPKGYVWASTETHGIDFHSSHYGQDYDQTLAQGRKNLVADITAGFAECGCEDTCKFDS